MNRPPDELESIESALASLATAPPAATASDAAYEAGRRDAAAHQRHTLWAHRGLTAAALLVASVAGVSSLATRGPQQPQAPAIVEAAPAAPERAAAVLVRSGSADSPLSYLSIRSAMIEGHGLDDLPAGQGPGDPATPSIADLLREQRGF